MQNKMCFTVSSLEWVGGGGGGEEAGEWRVVVKNKTLLDFVFIPENTCS